MRIGDKVKSGNNIGIVIALYHPDYFVETIKVEPNWSGDWREEPVVVVFYETAQASMSEEEWLAAGNTESYENCPRSQQTAFPQRDLKVVL